MTEYIEREAFRKALNEDILNDPNCPLFVAATVEQIIDIMPAAAVQEIRYGKWKYSASEGLPTKRFVCSECDGLVEVSTYRNRCMYNYCPTCGAKMEEENDTKR